jgi:hypothetical protein
MKFIVPSSFGVANGSASSVDTSDSRLNARTRRRKCGGRAGRTHASPAHRSAVTFRVGWDRVRRDDRERTLLRTIAELTDVAPVDRRPDQRIPSPTSGWLFVFLPVYPSHWGTYWSRCRGWQRRLHGTPVLQSANYRCYRGGPFSNHAIGWIRDPQQSVKPEKLELRSPTASGPDSLITRRWMWGDSRIGGGFDGGVGPLPFCCILPFGSVKRPFGPFTFDRRSATCSTGLTTCPAIGPDLRIVTRLSALSAVGTEHSPRQLGHG